MNTTRIAYVAVVLFGLSPMIGSIQAAEKMPLSSVDLRLMTVGWGEAKAKKSITGKTLRIGNREFAEGVGSHAESEFNIDLPGVGERFQAMVGVDMAAASERAVDCRVRRIRRRQGALAKRALQTGEAARPCERAAGRRQDPQAGCCRRDNGISYDHADWADAYITYSGAPPKAIPTAPETCRHPKSR